ncbi:RNA-binding protein [Arthrobacter pityocampae]|uniref:RNA-binding protein n=1 Tax=Arthrobacter pityocampae TaxID=547334 RepID=A0A2S5IZA1_9MICC|nr:ASCH domain-containing protein [Arthrobacter pityocampae]PPB49885.1 RNA-binding protein [Arthrobacter pityocampae]
MTNSSLPRAEFAFPGSLRDALVAAILDGRKTTTTSLLVEYAVEGEELPVAGRRQAVIDSSNEPVAVIETVHVEQVRLDQVPLAHVIDEGEGHTTIARWREAHEQFWHSDDMRSYLQDSEFTVTDETVVVLERFQLIS